MNAKEVLKAIEVLELDRGISKDILIDALVEALEKAYRKNFDIEIQADLMVRCSVDKDKGIIRLFNQKTVVDDVEDDVNEIHIDEARKIDSNYQLGDIFETEVKTDAFGRLAAVQAKQILKQKIREAEKQMIFDEFADRKDDIITGIIDRVEDKYVIINLGKTGAVLPQAQQMANERYKEGQHLKVYVVDVDKTSKGAQVMVSRSEPNLVKRLFELEVPEIFDGVVEIKSIAREAGERCKLAVFTKDDDVDAIGACIGPKGSRVQSVIEELHGEKIDIILWSNDPAVFIANALSPSKVTQVSFDEANKTAQAIVPDNQLSLAIGKKGQNARLSVRLTGYKIDIKSESDAKALGITFESGADEIEAMDTNINVIQPEPVVERIIEPEVMTMAELLEEPVIEEVEEVIEPASDVLPIYTQEELEAFDAEDVDFEEEEDVDYDEYDKYYDN